MSATDTPLADQLAKLRADAAAANEADKAAQYRATKGRQDAAREVTADLAAFQYANAHRTPDATPEDERPEKLRELTDAICDAVKERGLVFDLLKGQERFAFDPKRGGSSVGIVDPSVDEAVRVTRQELSVASAAATAFQRNNADALEAERRVADAQRNKDALASGDPERIKQALGLADPDHTGVLVSSDLSGPMPDRVTRPVDPASKAREDEESRARSGSIFNDDADPGEVSERDAGAAGIAAAERKRRAETRDREEAKARSGSGFAVPDDTPRSEV